MKLRIRVAIVVGSLSLAALQAACKGQTVAPAAQAAQMPPVAASVSASSPASATSPVSDAGATASASAPALAPGDYATEQGWGRLSIQRAAAGVTTFKLETENSGAGCSFSGRVSGTRATAYDGDTASACVIDLVAKGGAIALASKTDAACRAYCGGNGSYEGDYRRLDAACTPDAVQEARAAFKTLYDGKSYAPAAAALAPVYDHCLSTLGLVDEGGVRNDYALAQHKLGDDAACLAALDRYRDDIDRTDDQITDGMAPAIVDDYLAVVGAARTNARLCGRKPAR